MPYIVDTEDGVRGLDEVVLRERFDYSYPEGMDLHPTSDLHKTLVNQIMKRANESAREMKKSYSSWDRCNDSLELFARPDWRHQVSGSTEATVSRPRQLRREGDEDSGSREISRPAYMTR